MQWIVIVVWVLQFNDNSKAISSATGSATVNPLIGRRVQTRWPDDNAFYEAQIADYNPENVSINLLIDTFTH